MQVTLEQLEPCKVALKVEVEAEEVDKTLDQVFREIARQVNVPGFRKGRAPRAILEKFIAQDVLQEQAATHLLQEYYTRALDEKGVQPIAKPEVDAEPLTAGQPFRFTATVPTQPEVRLADYRDLPARRRHIEVTEQDVDAELDLLRHRATRLEDTDADVAGPGMIAIVDLDVYRGDRRLANRSREDAAIDMDDSRSVPAFNITVEGQQLGETREMPVHFPAEHQDPVLAGKDITFKITLKRLQVKTVPELTDEFVTEVTGLEGVDALRQAVRRDLEAAARGVADQEVRDQLVEQLVSRSEILFPEALVQERVDEAVRSQAAELERRGATLEEYLNDQGIDYATFERSIREDERRHIRTQLALEELADKESIQVSEADVDAEIARMAAEVGASASAMRAALERQGRDALSGIRVRLLFRKAVDRLLELANITEE